MIFGDNTNPLDDLPEAKITALLIPDTICQTTRLKTFLTALGVFMQEALTETLENPML